ncbi:MAG: AbgT family transporter [Lysobacterales bacterium]|jgi:uncharacterized ion transporter superfamily protein YfcC
MGNDQSGKSKIPVPHTYVLLLGIMLMAALATWLIPSGEFDRVAEGGRQIIRPDSYRAVAPNPAGLFDLATAFPKAMIEVAGIIFYIFIIGGAFGVLNETGAIRAGIHRMVRQLGNREWLIVPGLTLVFSIGGGTIGIAEETLVFLPTLYLLARSLGYDSLVAGGVALAGASAGFSSAFLNPFTVGVAQGIVGLPLFSGIEFRFIVWLVFTGVTVAYLSRYAAKVRAEPSKSLMYAIDREREPIEQSGTEDELTKRHLAVLLLCLGAMGALVVGAIWLHWGILELTALFFVLAVVAGPVGGLSGNATAQSFIAGAADMTYAGLVVGLARGSLVILQDANVMDTITKTMADGISTWPASVSALGIYFMQSLLNLIIPSGSGQAAVSLPILAPVGELIGITRQTSVLAYQLGDGLTNIFTPTQGYLMAALAILKIPWTVWARWLLPLLAIWFLLGAVAVLVARVVHFGPF